jgi:hypothetical protein
MLCIQLIGVGRVSAMLVTSAIMGAMTWLAIFEHNYQPADLQIWRGGDHAPGWRERIGLQSSTFHHLVAEWEKECQGVARPVTKRRPGAMLIGREQHEEALNDASDGRTASRMVWLCTGLRGET